MKTLSLFLSIFILNFTAMSQQSVHDFTINTIDGEKLDLSSLKGKKLLNILEIKALELNIYNKIHIVYGGSVGIAIYPSEYDKKQIMNHINHKEYDEIYYFGDKYLRDGNDYLLLNHQHVIGYKVDTVNQTYQYLKILLNK